MANKKYEETDIQAIAEAIREKTGSEDSYKVSAMASGVNEVYEAGKKAENKAFWDNFFMNDVKTERSRMFAGRGWNDKTFRPDRDILCYSASANQMFELATFTDLEAILNEQNIIIQFKNMGRVDNMFNYCLFMTVCPEIDFTGVNVGHIDNVWLNCQSVHTIRKVILPTNKSIRMNGTFTNNKALVNIEFEGLITQSPNFSSSPLSVASLKSIITHLKDYSGTTSESTYTVTFKTSAFEALEAEGSTAEYNGVACTWEELIDNLKWNLALA